MGMTALLVARPLFPSESAAQYGDGLSIVMLWIALGIFWLLGAIGRPRFAIRFGWTDAAVLLLIGWHTVAAIWAAKHGTPRPAVNMLWEWVGLGLGFLLTRQFIVKPREARAAAAVMVALAVAVAGYGLYQYVYEMPQTRAKYAADPDRAMREAGLWYPPDSPERERFEIRLQNREPIATFALTNSLAAFLAPWLVVLAAVACGCRQNRKWLLRAAICSLPILACLLLTKSRSGYIATGLGLALVWLICREGAVRIHWKWPLTIAAALALVVGVGLAVKGLDRDLFGAGHQIVRLPLAILGVELADDWRPSAFGLRAGQFSERLYAIQAARGGRRSGRPAQFPVGDLGHGWHAGHAGLLGRVGVLYRRRRKEKWTAGSGQCTVGSPLGWQLHCHPCFRRAGRQYNCRPNELHNCRPNGS